MDRSPSIKRKYVSLNLSGSNSNESDISNPVSRRYDLYLPTSSLKAGTRLGSVQHLQRLIIRACDNHSAGGMSFSFLVPGDTLDAMVILE